ncbi:MAG: gluconate 2-dehydrogenase subunit 3 family protein [Nocardioides sp.]|nr:gluconate 2-dehydrogenase subunit 3 family protein [Nocardioides sp.]
MTDDFPHTSRPGHYGLTIEPVLGEWVEAVSTALIPGNTDYPSAREAQVLEFVEQRVSPSDLELLGELSRHWPAAGDPAAAVAAMEAADPTSFAYLRELVYHGYYSSQRVLAAMNDRGYAYHGAPQPLGYRIDETMIVPSRPRGHYLTTADVSRVAH